MSHRDIHAAAIVVAAGSGERLGAQVPKALVELAGTPLVVRAVRGVIASATVRTVVVTAPRDEVATFTRLLTTEFGPTPPVDIVVIAGGKTRQESVANALNSLPPDTTHVLVHDAARSLTPPSQIKAVHAALQNGARAVIPALEVVDTIKIAEQRQGVEVATGTPERATLRSVQTPQGFELETLLRAHSAPAAAGPGASDDALLVEKLGVAVQLIPGSEAALKITTPADLERARIFLESDTVDEKAAAEPVAATISPTIPLPRTGIAIDVHPINTASDAPLCVAGLKWPDKPALSGHSDGDVVAHAVCDAVISAAGLGDLGTHFGTSDPKYAGTSGETFLQETARIVAEAGYQIGNVAVQLIGPFPRLGDRRLEAQETLSAALGAPVSLSATTTDGLGFVGRGDGLAAIATALVIRAPKKT